MRFHTDLSFRTCWFLDTLKARSHNENDFADVAELADAQVSEACDGDIVEVQVLSSAPGTK
jgi:hypothetical protein